METKPAFVHATSNQIIMPTSSIQNIDTPIKSDPSLYDLIQNTNNLVQRYHSSKKLVQIFANETLQLKEFSKLVHRCQFKHQLRNLACQISDSIKQSIIHLEISFNSKIITVPESLLNLICECLKITNSADTIIQSCKLLQTIIKLNYLKRLISKQTMHAFRKIESVLCVARQSKNRDVRNTAHTCIRACYNYRNK